MTLQSSGKLSVSDLAIEYNDSGSHSLGEFYGQPGVPASGRLSLSDFYGKSDGPVEKVFSVTGWVNSSEKGGDTFRVTSPFTLKIKGVDYVFTRSILLVADARLAIGDYQGLAIDGSYLINQSMPPVGTEIEVALSGHFGRTVFKPYYFPQDPGDPPFAAFFPNGVQQEMTFIPGTTPTLTIWYYEY